MLLTKVCYVCKKCYEYLRHNDTSETQKNENVRKTEKCETFLCTCCHGIRFGRNNVVEFKAKKYNWENGLVSYCLADSIRRRSGFHEYICRVCHRCLSSNCPRVPENSAALRLKDSTETIVKLKEQFHWDKILSTMGKFKTYESLERYVKNLVVVSEVNHIVGMQNDSCCRDYLAFSLIPKDFMDRRDEMMPVYTRGDGNCFVYSLSRIVYGNEDNGSEMRVRLVIEAVKSVDRYLDSSYLARGCAGSSDGDLCQLYASEFQFGVELSQDEIRLAYEKDVLSLCQNFGYCGVWQFHQAANVLKKPIVGVYPDVDASLIDLRKELNRVFLPSSGTIEGPVYIMWSKVNMVSAAFQHFVPILQRDGSDDFLDMNRFVDAVGGDNEISDVAKRRKTIHADEDFNSCTFLCTCCHVEKLRKNVKLFGAGDYSFSNDVVMRALSVKVRKCAGNGYEYICFNCHKSLSLKVPLMPRCAAGNFERCSKCKERFLKSKLKYFDAQIYGRGSEVDVSSIVQFERLQNEDGEEFICQLCDKYLQNLCVVVQKFTKEMLEMRDEQLEKSALERNTNRMKYESAVDKIRDKIYKKIEREEVKWRKKVDRNRTSTIREDENKRNRFKEKLLEEKDRAIENFVKSLKDFPEFVCTCCHRMLFRRGVIPFRCELYDYSCPVVADCLAAKYRYRDESLEEEFICATCHKNLKDCRMPRQAVANNLELPIVPDVLSGLTRLELRCISLRIPFMMIRAQRKGALGRITGPCVNVPTTIKPITAVLPRVPEDAQLVLVRLKRMLVYKSSYLSDYIRPVAVMNALRWLIRNNPFYSDVEVDHAWLEKFRSDKLHNDVCYRDEGEDTMDSRDGGTGADTNISSEEEEITEEAGCEDDDCTGMDEKLKDATLEEEQGEVTRLAEITVEPDSTCIEIDDIDQVVFNIAPGENSIPKFILMDDDFEVLSFPNMFPLGKGSFYNEERPQKIDLRRYINQRLLNKDGRFSQNMEYIFAFQYATELKQLKCEMNIALKKTSLNSHCGRMNAGNMRSSVFVSELVRNETAYKFMNNVRGTPAYWQQQLYDTLALLRTFGTPTWFLTLSPAEFLWPEFIQAIGRRCGRNFSEEEVNGMTWDEKALYLRSNPVTTCLMFQHRIECFFSEFLTSSSMPIGEIAEHCIKIEFQARGSPHAHCLIWIRGAPRLNEDRKNDTEVCDFVDKYIDGTIPVEEEEFDTGIGHRGQQVGELKYLVTKLQTHRHSSYCRPHVNAKCRFNFPRPPTTRTIIARKGSEDTGIDVKERKQILQLVSERMAKDTSLTCREILEIEGIPEKKYLECLKYSSDRGSCVILKREPVDGNTNNFNSNILSVWKANMDIQFCGDAYACIMYILSYVMKSEKGMSDVLKSAAKEFKERGVAEQMKKVVSAFANKREVGVHEAIYRVLSLWLFKKTRSVTFVNNSPKEMRTRMTKPLSVLQELDDEDENIFMTSIHERYEARPSCLEGTCLADFATKYSISNKAGRGSLKLRNDLGYVRLRKSVTVLRCHKYSSDDDKNYFSKLMLFLPYRSESDLLGEHECYEDRYNEIKDQINEKAREFNMDDETVDNAWEDFLRDPPQMDNWEEDNGVNEDIQEFLDSEKRSDVEVREDEKLYKSPLSLQYKAEASKDTISNQEYRRMMRGLNEEQKQIVMFNRKWIKESIVKIRDGNPVEGYQIFLSGSGGTGKSFVIKMIYRDNVQMFRKCLAFCGDRLGYGVDDVIALLTAFTGTAAFNINGATLHGALQVYQAGISDEKKTIMVTRLRGLRHITIDEVSMVGRRLLDLTNNRCAMVKHTCADDQNFGNISILAVGDMYQLPPVRAQSVFERKSNVQSAADLVPPIWHNFKFHELTKVMRQSDEMFAGILNEVRVGTPAAGSFADMKLKERELTLNAEDPNYPSSVLHIYKKNIHADARNEVKLSSLDGQLFTICAIDSTKDKEVDISKLRLPNVMTQTGNLRGKLLLKVGARVYMTCNIDVTDGLTNGVYGTVEHIVESINKDDGGSLRRTVSYVLVRFDSDRVGVKAKQRSLFRRSYPEAVPVSMHEVNFPFHGSKTVHILRKNFPLSLAWAVTIHKVQGMTVDEIVVDMTESKGRYELGQAYVALSRVRTYEKLHIINYSRKQIRASTKVHTEMARLKENRLPALVSSAVSSVCGSILNVTHINVQGLNVGGEGCKLTDLLNDNDVQLTDVLCLTETHLSRLKNVSGKDIWQEKRGTIFRKDRNDRSGGGVMVLVNDDLSHREIIFDCSIECVAVEICCPAMFVVVAVYIPPGMEKKECIVGLNGILNCLDQSHYDRVIVTGDFNEDLIRKSFGGVAELFAANGYVQHLKCPTTDYGSLLDHIYTKNIDNVNVDVQDCYYSDHDKTFCLVL